MNILHQFICAMPKVELHVHLESCFTPEMAVELSKRNRVKSGYKDVNELRAALNFHDLETFLAVYERNVNLLREEQDFFDITYSYLHEISKDNVLYAEMMFDPQAHTRRGIPFACVIDGIRKAQEVGRRQLGVESKLIMNLWRHLSADEGMQTLEAALPYKKWITGLGLDMYECGNPPLKFKEVYRLAKQEEFRLTAHCDVDQENSVTHIWQCLDDLQVDRIDHGNNCLDDPVLLEEVRQRGICLTVCPTPLPVDDGSAPIPRRTAAVTRMLDEGLCVTVNSDDPAYFCNWYMNEIMNGVQEAENLNKDELVQLMHNAFSSAWISEERRDSYLTRLLEHLSA